MCEGKMTYTSSGTTDLHATEGCFTTSATTTNNTHSGEGVNHPEYEPLHPNDTMDTSVDITLNLYFDGTNNNKFNTKAREENKDTYKKHAFTWLGNPEDDSSYDNGYTNVVHGFDATDADQPKQAVVYIDGIGTREEDEDEGVFGKGLATGATGYKVKVQKGCKEAAIAVKAKFDLSKRKTIDTLTVNLFGFSRGAATARFFLHLATNAVVTRNSDDGSIEVYAPTGEIEYVYQKKLDPLSLKHGYFGYKLAKNGLTNDKIKKIVFNFVGLYDTVSSYGANHNNDVTELGLKSISKAEMVFQIAADDEFRENFDLTNINSAGLKGLEITFPGVHSDIGGSYRNYTKELGPEIRSHYKAYYTKKSETDKETYYHNEALAIKKMLVSEGWYTEAQLTIIEKKDSGGSYNLNLIGSRELFNTFDKISLARMIAVTKQFKVLFKDSKVKELTQINDPFIKKVESQLLSYVKECSDLRNGYINEANENKKPLSAYNKDYLEKLKRLTHKKYLGLDVLKELRGKYLHWSVNNDKTGLGPRTNLVGYAGDLKKQELRKREIQDG